MQNLLDKTGHRSRLRERFLDSRPGTLPDYEMIEMILFMSQPRKDTKSLAKVLLNKFGSFSKVITASEQQLREIDGVGNSVIASLKIIYDASIRLSKEEAFDGPILENFNSLIKYVRSSMGRKDIEQFRVLYLDNKNMVIDDNLHQEGTINFVAVYPREIIKRCIYLSANSIILIHNHPSGKIRPSNDDIKLTKQIVKAVETIGIKVLDHIIISSTDHYSFKSNKLL